MNDPYVVSLGEAIYSALWDDPKRPKTMAVERWAKEVLTHYLEGKQDD